jgi:hypothetical protein
MRGLVVVTQALQDQRGASLIELLVGMALGLVVLAIAQRQQTLIHSQYQDMSSALSLSTAQRLAFRRINSIALQAGQWRARDDPSSKVSLSPPPAADLLANTLHLATSPNSSDATEDCLGRRATADGFLSSTFYVSTNNLRCNVGDRSGGQPVVEGFASMHTMWFVAHARGIQVVSLPDTGAGADADADADADSSLTSHTLLGHAICLDSSQTDATACAHSHAFVSVAWSPSAVFYP